MSLCNELKDVLDVSAGITGDDARARQRRVKELRNVERALERVARGTATERDADAIRALVETLSAESEQGYAYQHWAEFVLRDLDRAWCAWRARAAAPATPRPASTPRRRPSSGGRRPSRRSSAARRAVDAIRRAASPRRPAAASPPPPASPDAPRMQSLVRNLMHDLNKVKATASPRQAAAAAGAGAPHPPPPPSPGDGRKRFRRRRHEEAHRRHFNDLREQAVDSIRDVNRLSPRR